MASPTTSTALVLHFLKMTDILMMTNTMTNHINRKNLNKNLVSPYLYDKPC